jgi:hypothetical protein
MPGIVASSVNTWADDTRALWAGVTLVARGALVLTDVTLPCCGSDRGRRRGSRANPFRPPLAAIFACHRQVIHRAHARRIRNALAGTQFRHRRRQTSAITVAAGRQSGRKLKNAAIKRGSSGLWFPVSSPPRAYSAAPNFRRPKGHPTHGK